MNLKPIITLIIVLINVCSGVAQEIDTIPITYRKPLFDFELTKPVFKLNEEQQKNSNRFLRFSVLTGYRQGVIPIQGFANFANYQDENNGTTRLYMFNLSIQDILTHGLYKSNRVLLEVKNPSHYRYDSSLGSKEEWTKRDRESSDFPANCPSKFCAASQLPTTTSKILSQ